MGIQDTWEDYLDYEERERSVPLNEHEMRIWKRGWIWGRTRYKRDKDE